MSRRVRFALLGLGACTALVAWLAVGRLRAMEGADAATGALSDAEVRDADIALYEARAAADPAGAADRAQVALLYLRRAREEGSAEDYGRAERWARASLERRAGRNAAARHVLVASLLAQHRFVEARVEAERLLRLDPASPAYRALLGEVRLELGDYAGAAALLRPLVARRRDPSVGPRVARWLELTGHADQARRIMRALLADAARRHETGEPTREQLAWFHLRVGDLELQRGHVQRAREAYEGGLLARPDDRRLLAAMARLEATLGRWRRAADYGELAFAAGAPDPATLGLVGEAYEALGDTAQAASYYRAMETTVAGQPGAYHRAWALVLLDHGRRVPEVLDAALRELETRRDVYGYDVAAWALYRSGRHAEAHATMARALAQGTEDPLLLYHAGMIARALGRESESVRHLERALLVNPRFRLARAALE